MRSGIFQWMALVAVAWVLLVSAQSAPKDEIQLLNVSFDPTRELYKAINEAFIADWKAKTGETVSINQSHGGSGKQARSVIEGLQADVVTLALASDVDRIAGKAKLLPTNWANRLPHNSVPFSSTIVFLVKKGNPKAIHDWGDLAMSGLQVVTPNPKTSGGARWNFLAAWAWAQRNFGGDETKIKSFVSALYANVPVLDTGARASTTTFAERGIGDVLITWESDAFLALEHFGADKFQIVYPSLSISAETPVALVDDNAKANKTLSQANAYLSFLFTPPAQRIAAKMHFRPSNPEAADPSDLAQFQKLELVTIEGAFGGWTKAQEKFFAEGAIFDQLYKSAK